MSLSERYPAWQFAVARIALGLYLAHFFFWLAPHAPDLYTSSGIYAERPATGFPNPIAWLDTPGGVRGFVWGLGLLSLAFAAGRARRVLAVVIWFGYACLFERLIYVAVPQAHFIGWILLATCIVPPGEPALGRPGRADWRMPPSFLVAAWIVLAIPYTASGWSKLEAPSFVDGQALLQIFESPIGRRWWFTALLRDAAPLLVLLTWGSVALELFFAPLCLFGWGRALVWLSMSAMHVGIVLTLGIADVPGGMLVYHLFVFDVGWLRGAERWAGRRLRKEASAPEAPSVSSAA